MAPRGEYLTDRGSNRGRPIYRTESLEAFFVYLPHYAVHTPIQAKEEAVQHFRAKARPMPRSITRPTRR